ncbi:MAG: MFS transporter [Bacteroidetes bacterium]|nr:MFS transporter [Bacteroidota bacterium]
MSRKELTIIVLLASINFTHILDFMIMMPLGNYLMPAFNISPKQFSILLASYPISSFVAGLIMFFLADKFERKKLLLFTYTGFIIGTAACGFANSYYLLLIARIVAGLFGGIIGGQVLAMIGDLFPYERRGTAMGAVMSAFAIASSVGVTISLYLVELFHDNWHTPFLLVALLGLIILYLASQNLPVLNSHLKSSIVLNKKFSFQKLYTVLAHKESGKTLLFSSIMMMGHFLIIPFITSYMEFNMGYSKSVIPVVYLVGGLASLLAALFLGRLSDKVGKLKVFTYCVILSFGFVIILTNLPVLPFFIVLIFFAIWFALATGRAVTSQTMVTGITSDDNRGGFMSLNSSVQQLGTGLASLTAGFIVTENKSAGKLLHYEWVGYLSVLVLFLGLLLGRFLFKHIDKKSSHYKTL